MEFKFLARDEISRLSRGPGVYCFKNRKILYIGKASNIRERVKNHFLQPGFKERIFLDKTKKIGFIKTNSEIEALILEANLIKKYQPKYNVIWRDDKNYFFAAKTKEDFPRIFWTHQTKIKRILRKKQKIELDFVGPFVDGKALKETLKVLRRIFPYRSCKSLPKRTCLWYHLGRCLAPCLLKSKILEVPEIKEKIEKEIQRNANLIFEIIRGRKSQVLKELKKEMNTASKIEDFEKAAKIRDQISALEKILAHARIFEIQPVQEINWLQIQKGLKEILAIKKAISRIEAYDISNIQGKLAVGSMVIFIKGKPEKNFYRKFKIKISGKPNDIAMIKEVLSRRFKHPEWPFPDLILIDGGKAQLSAAIQCLRPECKNFIKIMALAKRKNELYVENQREPILLKALPREIFNLILQLRDEAHRFAISYHRKLRKKILIAA